MTLWLEEPPGTHTHIGLMASTSVRLEDPTTIHVERRPTDGGEPQAITLHMEQTVEVLSPALLHGLLRLAGLYGEDLNSELRISESEFRVQANTLFKWWMR